jgi:hypothetical protein
MAVIVMVVIWCRHKPTHQMLHVVVGLVGGGGGDQNNLFTSTVLF